MNKIFILIFFVPILFVSAQKMGEMAQEKPAEIFPMNAWGVDIMFSEGGFGLGTFFRKSFNTTITGFLDLSISESKDDREFEFYDYFGRPIVIGKENRVFVIPITAGIHIRLFEEELTDNLRPYIQVGVGPTIAVTTPYEQEFFNAFGSAQSHLAIGGYAGFGANFGLSKSNLLGLSFRYYYAHFIDEGVENLTNQFRRDIGTFYLLLNIGIMY